MNYRRMPIEVESPESLGYEKIECNLAESSFADQQLSDLGISIQDLTLFYGDHKGKSALREQIASEINLHGEHVLITPGAAPALFIVATSLLEKNDHIIVAKTNYATNIETPRAIGAKVSMLHLQFENNFQLNTDELESMIAPNTKLVSLTYPHNPTGVMIDEATLHRLVNIAEKKGVYLLLDETYREMSFDKPLPVAATLSPRVISVSSMSKSYGLPGIRIGWLITRDKQLMETFLAAKEQIFITNSVVDEEIAHQFLLRKNSLFPRIKNTIDENFKIVKQFMNGQDKLEWVEPGGGCVCFPRIKGTNVDTTKFYDILLNKYATYVGPGHWFEENDRHMRIGFGWETKAKLKKGLDNILNAIQEAIG